MRIVPVKVIANNATVSYKRSQTFEIESLHQLFGYKYFSCFSLLNREIDWQNQVLQMESIKMYFFAWLQHNYFRFCLHLQRNLNRKKSERYFFFGRRLQTKPLYINVQAFNFVSHTHSSSAIGCVLPQQNKEISWNEKKIWINKKKPAETV